MAARTDSFPTVIRLAPARHDVLAVLVLLAMARGLRPGATFESSLGYGAPMSLGVYYGFRILYPIFFHDRLHTVALLNGAVTFCAVLLPLPLYGVFRWRFTPSVAAAGTLLVVLSPLIWEADASFHPAAPSLTFLTAAMFAFGRGVRRPGRWPWTFASAAILFIALATRAEVALAFPGLAWGAWRADRRAARGAVRALPAALAAMLIASSTYAAIAEAHRGAPSAGLAFYVQNWLLAYFEPAAIPRNVIWAALSIGVGSATLALIGLRKSFAARGGEDDRTGRDGVGAAFAVALVALVFWLPIGPVVMRHFILVVPAAVWLACETSLRLRHGAPLALAALVLLVVNLALPEAFYAALNRARPSRSLTPIGTFFSDQARIGRDLMRERPLAKLTLCENAGDPGGPPGNCRGALVQVNWHGGGTVLLGMAEGAPDFSLVRERGLPGGPTLREYRVGSVPVRVLIADVRSLLQPGSRGEAARRLIRVEADSAWAQRQALVIPREALTAHLLSEPASAAATQY